jgi:ATP-dependent RNA helicase RhlE
MTNITTKPPLAFSDLGISPLLLSILEKTGIKQPTPIQEKSIPTVLLGKDVIGIAQTGTGKTLAFGLPMIQLLAKKSGSTGLIVLPTRELAMQVEETLKAIGSSLGLRTAILVGGASMGHQISMIRQKPHVVVATPGRLNDHIKQRTIDLSTVSILVLDEADRMLDMGFEPQIKAILATVPKIHQTLLFSATMPPKIRAIAENYMKLPVTVQIAVAGSTTERISQELYMVSKDDKVQLLDKLLSDHNGTVLVFSRTKHGAKKLTNKIKDMGHTSTDIHSNKSLSQRKAALDGFKSGRHRVLVATDIAARGIDVSDIELVVNFDLPDNPEDYVHRIGRTGRAGKMGKAISFAEHGQRYDVKEIERLMKKNLKLLVNPVLPPKRASVSGGNDVERPERPRFNRFGKNNFGRSNSKPAVSSSNNKQYQTYRR